MTRPAGVRSEMIRVYKQSRNGELDPLDAWRLTAVLKEILNCVAVVELERRLDAVESGNPVNALPRPKFVATVVNASARS